MKLRSKIFFCRENEESKDSIIFFLSVRVFGGGGVGEEIVVFKANVGTK